MIKSLRLRTKITLLVIIVELVSISVTAFFIGQWTIFNLKKEIEVNIMNIAQIIANTPSIKKALSENNSDKIQPIVETVLKSSQKVEIIVVADMDGIRYGHPNPERIGQRFVGGDEMRVINTGESYTSEATGTLGKAIRAFVPIYNNNNEQIGFAMAGALTESVGKAKRESIATIIFTSFYGLFVGIIGAFLLANNIKNTLLGLEPEEISKLYTEKKGMLDAAHEGIIAINSKCEITLVNDSAIDMLQIKEKEVVGKNVLEVFPKSRLPIVLETGVAEYDSEDAVNDTIVVANRVPIKEGNKIVGVIATFRDKTMITRLAEEVTGVKMIIESLRANTHEFMNKLHVILGLIQLGDYEEAKGYIINETEKQQQIISLIMNKIKDPSVGGLILGKFSRAKELGIKINISNDTYLDKQFGKINSNVLVTIIGNLIENSMEAIMKSYKDEKLINLLIKDTSDKIIIQIKDNGIGIKKIEMTNIYNRGYSTKKGSNGVGLSLVKEVVMNLGGQIELESEENKYTKFTVVLPKGDQ